MPHYSTLFPEVGHNTWPDTNVGDGNLSEYTTDIRLTLTDFNRWPDSTPSFNDATYQLDLDMQNMLNSLGTEGMNGRMNSGTGFGDLGDYLDGFSDYTLHGSLGSNKWIGAGKWFELGGGWNMWFGGNYYFPGSLGDLRTDHDFGMSTWSGHPILNGSGRVWNPSQTWVGGDRGGPGGDTTHPVGGWDNFGAFTVGFAFQVSW